MIQSIQQGLLADGIAVPLTKLCAWFGVPRRTVYYKPTKAAPRVDARFADPIKAMIEKEPPFGYRTLSDGAVLEADRLLSAAGVVPNVEGLGLEALGVTFDRGAVRTEGAGRTSVPGLYAIGDLAGPPMLAHKAEHDGIACVEAIVAPTDAAPHKAPIPACIYASPQVASVGLTEEAARAAGLGVRLGRFSLRGNGKALVLGEPEGLVKCVFDAATDSLVGAQIIGAEASELIHGLTIAITLGATSAQLATVVFPHPTLSEALHEAVLAARDGAIHA